MKRAVCALLPVVMLSLILSGCSTRKDPVEPIPVSETPAFGPRILLNEQTVGANGGALSVTGTGTPLDGLAIDVPKGAFSNDTIFKISYAQIDSLPIGPLFHPVTPLITIDCGGQAADEIMTLTIPIDISPDEFAIGYYYDPASGEMEGIPSLYQDEKKIVLATKHFSSVLVSSMKEAALLEQRNITTNFKPGTDDWHFENEGSYFTKEGNCVGQVISSLWYFRFKKLTGGPQLWGLLDNDRGEPTPAFYYDDTLAYRMVSSVQVDSRSANNSFTFVEQYMDRKLTEEERELNRSEVMNQWLALRKAMLQTGRPQIIVALGTRDGKKQGHALIAYGIEDDKILLADPNYPGSTERFTVFSKDGFSTYHSGQNVTEIAAGRGVVFDKFYWAGEFALIDSSKVESRWREVEREDAGNEHFIPPKVFLRQGNNLYQNRFSFDFELDDKIPRPMYMSVYYKEKDYWHEWPEAIGEMVTYSFSAQLKEGANTVGIFLHDRSKDWYSFQWLDFFLDTKMNLETDSTTIIAGSQVEIRAVMSSGILPPDLQWYLEGKPEEILGEGKTFDFIAPDATGDLVIHARHPELEISGKIALQVTTKNEEEPPKPGEELPDLMREIAKGNNWTLSLKGSFSALDKNLAKGTEQQTTSDLDYFQRIKDIPEVDSVVTWSGDIFTAEMTWYDKMNRKLVTDKTEGKVRLDRDGIASLQWLEISRNEVEYDEITTLSMQVRFEDLPMTVDRYGACRINLTGDALRDKITRFEYESRVVSKLASGGFLDMRSLSYTGEKLSIDTLNVHLWNDPSLE